MKYTPPNDVPGGIFPGVSAPLCSFYVGDGQDGVPVNGQTQLRVVTLCGQNIVNKQLLVLREGIELMYADGPDPATEHQISRYNNGGLGGFDMNTNVGPGSFVGGDRFDVFITGTNFTIDP